LSALGSADLWGFFISNYRRLLMFDFWHERGRACDQCGKASEGLEVHEAFVPRNRVKGWRQFFIFRPENCVLLCHKCHQHPDREKLLEVQRARGYELDDRGLWPRIKEILKVAEG